MKLLTLLTYIFRILIVIQCCLHALRSDEIYNYFQEMTVNLDSILITNLRLKQL